jgi:serine/threonine protein kinase/lipoprotein NlpI
MALNLLNLFQPANSEKPLGGRYIVISELGAGGFGQTFLAEDLHLPGQPRCVVKQFKPQVSDAESLQTASRLFETEARVLYQLGIHDQIPRLLAHFEDNQEFYLAQELVEGEPLTQELILGQPWSEAKVVALLQDILYVLAFVHQQNVIHRDIKPSNLMRRREDYKIVLIDFGAVKQVSSQVVNTKTGQTNLTISIGTQGYMPSEQLSGNPRFSSDLYAVGMIGIQALTGVHPKNLSQDPQTGEVSWRDRTRQVSPELAAILDCMVRYDFRARYRSAVEAMDALSHLPANLAESLPPQPLVSEPTEVVMRQEFPSPTLTGLTAPGMRQPQPSTRPQSRRIVVPTTVNQTRSLKPGTALAVLLAVGASFFATKTLLSSQFANSQSPIPRVLAKKTTAEVEAEPNAVSIEESTQTSEGETAAPEETANEPEESTSSVPTSATGRPEVEASPEIKQSAAVVTPPRPVQAAAPVAPAAPAPSEPKVADVLAQAERLRQGGQYQKAIQFYDQALSRKSDISEAHWGRCYSLNSLQQINEAIAACNEALAINPNYPEALTSKGYALEQQQRHLEALKLYEQATDVKPNFADAWNNRGSALLVLGRSSEAVDAFDKATSLKPDFADAWANRGAALWDLGQLDLAIASMDKALQIQPNNSSAVHLRQLARQKLGR